MRRRWLQLSNVVLAGLLAVGTPACQKHPVAIPTESGTPLAVAREVRVLLVDRQPGCQVRVDGPFSVRGRDGTVVWRSEPLGWMRMECGADRGVVVGPRPLGPGPWDLIPQHSGSISVTRTEGSDGSLVRRYAGSLRIVGLGPGQLRLLNIVDVESYVACVLPNELYPSFHVEAYRAQAVAARTYVLYQMARRAHEPYDVVATESSQVYGGISPGSAAERAWDATKFTRGIAATWTSPVGEQIFCTFYSSCCGGVTQDVANCKGDVESIPPLAGGVLCDCKSVAPPQTARWGPVEISKEEFTNKLASRYPHFGSLGRLERLDVIERTPHGRPKMVRLSGSGGGYHDLRAEDLRLAIGSRTLRSTMFQSANRPASFAFTQGLGFGHGMGMCQWGMQAMALQGKRAGAILKHYYPTMNLTRVY